MAMIEKIDDYKNSGAYYARIISRYEKTDHLMKMLMLRVQAA